MTEKNELNDHKLRGHGVCSPSSSATWTACPPSARMCEEIMKHRSLPDGGTKDSRKGTVGHEIADKLLNAHKNGEKFPTVEDLKPSLIAQGYQEFENEFQEIYDTVLEKYVKLIIELKKNVKGTIYPEIEVDFSYLVPEGYGTSDCIITSEDTLYVIDLKYGLHNVEAVGNPQLRLYALGALKMFEDPLFSNFENVCMTIIQPRVENVVKQEVMTVQELKDWGETFIRPRAKLAWEGKGELKTGEHCRFCKAKGVCPAQFFKFREFFSLLLDEEGSLKSRNLTAEELSKILPALEGAEAMIRTVRTQAEQEIILGNEVSGYKPVYARGKEVWDSEDDAVERMHQVGLSDDVIYKSSIITPSQVKALVSDDDWRVISQATVYKKGKLTIAPEDDKRQKVSRAEIDSIYDLDE